ncbi:hypothetical protein [Bizionia psychrotolerans]|uniref:hypothetical protein n=1 Tax=Bizionia psychrotolerans TaxID=1492901 RepID=UPI000651C436|nr:hypothetical protein [Bizionia psychrotolerans]
MLTLGRNGLSDLTEDLDGRYLLPNGDGSALTDIDAETLDNLNSTQFLRSDVNTIKTSGAVQFNNGTSIRFGDNNDSQLYQTGLITALNLTNTNTFRIYDNYTVRLTLDRTTGNLTANKFIGDGSSLTDVDAETLDNLNSSDFVRSTGVVTQTITGNKTFNQPMTVDSDFYVKATKIRDTGASVVISNNYLGGGVKNIFIRPNGDTNSSKQLQLSSDGTFKIDGNNIWHSANDGSGSGLDADLLDGLNSTDFVRSSGNVTENIGGLKTFTRGIKVISDSDSWGSQGGVQLTSDATGQSSFIWMDNSNELNIRNSGGSGRPINISPNGGVLNVGGTLNVNGNATANSFIKDGGTSSQFLKADGSVDSSTYLQEDISAWQTFTIAGGVSSSGSIKYKLINGRLVFIGALIASTNGRTKLGTLSSGFRPDTKRRSYTSYYGILEFETNGDVYAELISGVSIDLDAEIILDIGY